MADQSHPESEQPLPVTRRAWLKTAALSVALLFSGAVIGSGVTVIALRRRAEDARQHPDWLSRRTVDRMRHKLDLSDEQTEEIRRIIAESRDRARTLRREHWDEAKALMETMHEDVSAVLTPEQRAEWEEWIRRARERTFRKRDDRDRDRDRRRPPRREGEPPPPPPDGPPPGARR